MPTVMRAGYPTAVMFAESSGRKAVNQLLWGDYVTVTGEQEGERLPVRAYGYEGWVQADELQAERVLEIVFVDIGQGDGCLVVMPDDRKLLIDAGDGDNMFRFLRWRFGKFQKPIEFDSVVMSHSDLDHYGGFAPIFAEDVVTVKRVFHNGLVERKTDVANNTLGARSADGKFVTEIVSDTAKMRALLSDAAVRGGKKFPTMLFKALESGRFSEFQAVGVRKRGEATYLPGYEEDKPISIEVLGPVAEKAGSKWGLRWFGDVGKTKNGHSVVLKLRFGVISVLLGGDLNIPSEQLLLTHHTGLHLPDNDPAAEDAVIAEARKVLECDFAKACHHGSADFSDLFLRSVNPMATIISSGDDEPHCHPRADALGTIGRCGRGRRPLIFSTELSRSSSERVTEPNKFRAMLLSLAEDMAKASAEGDEPGVTKARDKLKKSLGDIDRSVAVYGAINLRTDGQRAVMAYKIERASKPEKKWDVYTFEPGADGRIEFRSKHDD